MTVTIREPGSALTHLLGVILTVMGAFPLLIRAALTGDRERLIGMSIFAGSMILLYTASTVYHSVSVGGRTLRIFRKIDHMMIFVLIAGSYTPICILVLGGRKGYLLLGVIWGLALLGMGMKAVWITCPKWVSSTVYIVMGWVCVFVFGDLWRLLRAGAFFWLLLGGIIYTAGGVIYALKLPLFRQRAYFGNHELFHLFVMGGSICHFICMYCFLT